MSVRDCLVSVFTGCMKLTSELSRSGEKDVWMLKYQDILLEIYYNNVSGNNPALYKCISQIAGENNNGKHT